MAKIILPWLISALLVLYLWAVGAWAVSTIRPISGRSRSRLSRQKIQKHLAGRRSVSMEIAEIDRARPRKGALLYPAQFGK